MKLTAKIKLTPSPEQHESLLLTLRAANAACNYISEQAWAVKRFGRVPVHQLTYRTVRETFLLGAQIAIRCIGKVVDAYKVNKKSQAIFKPNGGIAYDSHNLKYFLKKQAVSIWTLDGRLVIPFQAGERQFELLQHQQGESDLAYIQGTFYLFATCEIEEPKPIDVLDILGVDMGVTNIATTSDGEQFSNEAIERNRQRIQRLRGQLQKRGTPSAKRHLKRLAGRQQRFQADVNHCISKKLVQTAQHTNRAIAIEELKGIGARTRVRGANARAKHSNWSFAQLGFFVNYKAVRAGITVVGVNPAYTSQRCHPCGHVEKANRQSQSQFRCCKCGHTAHADVNAAKNIVWVAVNRPIVAGELGANPTSVTSLRLYAGGR